jgi:hypothetical protein
MTLGEQRRKALELLAPPPSRHDHSDGGIPRRSGQRFEQPLSYSRPIREEHPNSIYLSRVSQLSVPHPSEELITHFRTLCQRRSSFGSFR